MPLLSPSDVPVEGRKSGNFNKRDGGGGDGTGSGAATHSVDSSAGEEEEEGCGKDFMAIMNQMSVYMEAGQYEKASAHSRKCLGQ